MTDWNIERTYLRAHFKDGSIFDATQAQLKYDLVVLANSATEADKEETERLTKAITALLQGKMAAKALLFSEIALAVTALTAIVTICRLFEKP